MNMGSFNETSQLVTTPTTKQKIIKYILTKIEHLKTTKKDKIAYLYHIGIQ